MLYIFLIVSDGNSRIMINTSISRRVHCASVCIYLHFILYFGIGAKKMLKKTTHKIISNLYWNFCDRDIQNEPWLSIECNQRLRLKVIKYVNYITVRLVVTKISGIVYKFLGLSRLYDWWTTINQALNGYQAIFKWITLFELRTVICRYRGIVLQSD